MATDWSVHLDIDIDPPIGPDDDDTVAALLDALAPAGASLGLGETLGVTFTVDPGKTPIGAVEAVSRAVAIVTRGLADVGRPVDPATAVCRVEAMPGDDLAVELDRPAFPALAGISEIADMLGVSRQRAHRLAVTRPHGFPPPITFLAAGPVWRKADLSRFAEQWPRKPGRPRAAAS